MRQTHHNSLMVMVYVLTVLAAFLVGYRSHEYILKTGPVWAAMATPSESEGALDNSISLRPVQLYQEALDNVRKEYVEPITNKDQDEMVYDSIRGMLKPLNDPYTRFMDPKEYADFRSDNVGHFVGIGATLNMREIPGSAPKEGEGTAAPVICPVCGTVISAQKHYRVAVVEPLPGSPAKNAGLQPGDFIMKVDDKPTDGQLVSEVADEIRGPNNTQVTLTLARKGIEKPIVVTITRAKIEVPSVESKVLENNIGYLRLFSFNEKTSTETRNALHEFAQQHVSGVLLDLRNNPGGLLTESISVASMLLPADDHTILTTKGRHGNPLPNNRTTEEQLCTVPIVVLVNKGSASASEILSGALKDYKRAQLVGETTFGKALVQTVIPMTDGSAMAITTAHYYTPSGYDLGKKGINPDVLVKLDKDAPTIDEKDNQAQAAIKILQQEMAKK